MTQNLNLDRLRASIAHEAARILNDLGQRDYNTARTKAAQHLGCKDQKRLPSNTEIEQALLAYQQLFHADNRKQSLHDLRQLAIQAMSNLKQFAPRLVGPVLSGTADSNTLLQLHLFADSPEQIIFFLMERGIPYRESEKTLSFPKGKKQRQPAFRFRSGDTEVELIWFPLGTIGHPPLSSLDQRPEKRASLAQLKTLLSSE
jgi:hypothetical protein